MLFRNNCQGSSSQILNHTTDARLAILLAIYFSKYFSYLRLCKSLTVQAACQQLTLFFLIAKKCQDGMMKVAVPVARYPELEYSTLAVTAATAKTVTLVPFTVAKKLPEFGHHHTLNHQFHQILQAFFPVQMLDKCFRKLFLCKIQGVFFFGLTLFACNAKLKLKTFSYGYARHTL